jgi:hypothetical protein
MKIQDIPQSGKLGIQVSMPGRYGQVRRILAIPSNPQTTEQMAARNRLGTASVNWAQIEEAQRLAWVAAAANHQTRARLGQSGPMTGEQLFIKINCNSDITGDGQVTDPPAVPAFDTNICTGIELTNPGGVPAIKFVITGTSTQFHAVWACPPLGAGRMVASGWNYLGELPTPAAGKSTITTLFNAKFGAPVAGQKIWLRCAIIKNGWSTVPVAFSATVPAST